MNTPINDGGPAFPSDPFTYPDGQIQWGHNGMTLRDYLASKEGLEDWNDGNAVMSKSMSEALAGEAMPDGGWAKASPLEMFRFEAKWRAALKYIRADAMIAQRDKA
jgi:hypothetical protein